MLGIVIQARSGSTRLPNKMNLKFYEDFTILDILIFKLKTTFPNTTIVLATTENKLDDTLVKKVQSHNIKVFRGSESNVLDRFVNACKFYKLQKVIRVCADNPFLDMSALREIKEAFYTSNADYMSYQTKDGTPSIKTHYGFWAEAVKLSALEKVQELTNNMYYLEHVTNYIYSHPNMFNTEFFQIPEYLHDTDIRLTIDTKADFEIAKELYQELLVEKKFSIKKIYNKILERKDWLDIMSIEIKKQKK